MGAPVASLQRIGAGVGAAIILGPIVGFLMGTSKTFGTIVEPLHQLPARTSAAGLHRPADRLVRYRRHLEDLAAVPRRVPRDRDLDADGVLSVKQDQINAARALAPAGPRP